MSFELLRRSLLITLLALANLALVAVAVVGIAAIARWSHPDATDGAQWALIAILIVHAFIPKRGSTT